MSDKQGTARPSPLRLRHIALQVADLPACERFYRDILGLEVAWRPDDDNVYLTSGSDKLALQRRSGAPLAAHQSLDHIGFALEDEAAVDAWHDHLSAHGIAVASAPRTHRDGTRSFYCGDPEGNVVQLLFDPLLDRESEKSRPC